MKNYLTIAGFMFLLTIICDFLITKWETIRIEQIFFATVSILVGLVGIFVSVYSIKKGDK